MFGNRNLALAFFAWSIAVASLGVDAFQTHARLTHTHSPLSKPMNSDSFIRFQNQMTMDSTTMLRMANNNNNSDNDEMDNFDGQGFANYLLPYALALIGSILATAAVFKFVLLDY